MSQHLPGPTSGRSASPSASPCSSSAWSSAGSSSRVGAAIARRLRLPLGARPRRRGLPEPSRAPAGAEAAAGRASGRRTRRPTTAERYPRTGSSRLDARPRRGDRRPSSPSRCVGFMVAPAFRSQRYRRRSTSGRSPNFPEGKCVITTFVEDPDDRARSRGARRSSATTACSARAAELHDHLEPLRPPRLPGAAERPGRREADSTSTDKERLEMLKSPPASRPASAARATAASTTPRATAPPGPPVRALDRYEFSISNGHLVLGKRVQRRAGRRHAGEAQIHKYDRSLPGRSTSTAGIESLALARSRDAGSTR